MKFAILLIPLIFFSCAKPKSVLICGDHICVNKAEAEQFFNDNLSIEVKIISKEKEKRFDLVKLNLENKENNSIIVTKNKSKKIIKKLSKKEILDKKKEIKTRKKLTKLNKKSKSKKENIIKKKSKDELKKKSKKNVDIVGLDISRENKSSDICLMVKKCDIDSITKYLIKLSNKKDYPNINLRN